MQPSSFIFARKLFKSARHCSLRASFNRFGPLRMIAAPPVCGCKIHVSSRQSLFRVHDRVAHPQSLPLRRRVVSKRAISSRARAFALASSTHRHLEDGFLLRFPRQHVELLNLHASNASSHPSVSRRRRL